MCGYRRRYEYLLPAFAFDRTACRPSAELREAQPSTPHAAEKRSSAAELPSEATDGSAAEAPATIQPSDPAAAAAVAAVASEVSADSTAKAPATSQPGDQAAAADAVPSADAVAPEPQTATPFEFTAECRQRLNDILQHYKGTHNFHNYTIKVRTPLPATLFKESGLQRVCLPI